jgi:hypothetical protein
MLYLARTGDRSLRCNRHGSEHCESRQGHHKLTHCCLPFSFLVVKILATGRDNWVTLAQLVLGGILRAHAFCKACTSRLGRNHTYVTEPFMPPL